MPSSKSRDVTELLLAWSGGDRAALAELMPLVYDRLRALAASRLRHERGNHTLETAALVNEAFLRLIDQRRARWQDRAQFFAICAQFMRRILVDHARHRAFEKRGGGEEPVPIDEVRDRAPTPAPDTVALDEALKALAARDEELSRVVELRYFGGLNRDEIAEVTGLSSATVTRRWRMARAWLYQYLVAEEPIDL